MRKVFQGKFYIDYHSDYTEAQKTGKYLKPKEYIEIGFYNEANKEEETVDVQFILRIPVWEIKEIIG